MRKYLCYLILLLCTDMEVSAQTDTRARLDSLFDALAARGRVMGSICISQRGSTIYRRAIGYSAIDSSRRTAAHPWTRYRVASLTKMYTASILFQLIQEGRIDFENTLEEYYPELPGAKDITIGMMMGHRSGLHNIYDDPDFSSWKQQPRSEADIVAMIGRSPLDFAPGTRSAYSNSNYLLLGYIIERICRKPYREVVHDRIIARIGLKDTYYGSSADPDRCESYSYAYAGDWIRQPEADMSILGGAGALVSTPADMVRFVEAIYAHRLFKARYLPKMQQAIDGFGMGMMPFSFGTRQAYGHPGGIDGFSALIEYFPEEEICICYCSNGQDCSSTDVVTPVLSIIFDSALGN